jgi:hypothetical protein
MPTYHERLRLICSNMKDGTSFLEKLDEQSIFWGNVLDPGNQQSARRRMAFAGLAHHETYPVWQMRPLSPICSLTLIGTPCLKRVRNRSRVPMTQITHQGANQLSRLLVVCIQLLRARDGFIRHELGSKVELERERRWSVTFYQKSIARKGFWLTSCCPIVALFKNAMTTSSALRVPLPIFSTRPVAVDSVMLNSFSDNRPLVWQKSATCSSSAPGRVPFGAIHCFGIDWARISLHLLATISQDWTAMMYEM